MSAMYERLKAAIAEMEDDMDKFQTKANKAAGTRVRKKLQEIKKLSQDLRKEILEKSKD